MKRVACSFVGPDPLIELTAAERTVMKARRGRAQLRRLADKIGVSWQTLQKWERGERRAPLEKFRRWCEVLGVDPENISRQQETATIESELENDFEEFWSISIKKASKGDALKAYKAARKQTSKQTIHKAYERHVIEMSSREAIYRPYPATWIRAKGWLDENDKEPRRTMDDAPRSQAEVRIVNGRHALATAALARANLRIIK
jgi:transcriptional regulator with XRE-family HTH domain